MLRRYQDAGAKGFGEHKPGVKVDDPLNMAHAACSELKLPLLFHLDNDTQYGCARSAGFGEGPQRHFLRPSSSATATAGGHRFPVRSHRPIWGLIRGDQ